MHLVHFAFGLLHALQQLAESRTIVISVLSNEAENIFL